MSIQGKQNMGYFDFVAPFYNRLISSDSHEFISELRDYINPCPDDRILDVGGGTGRIAAEFTSDAAEVVVLDPSKGMLEQGKRNVNLTFKQARAESIPFADQHFTKILCINAFHHVQRQDQVIEEMKRVLSSDGWMIIEELSGRLARLLEGLFLRCQFYKPEELKRKFERHGLVASLLDVSNPRCKLLVRKGK